MYDLLVDTRHQRVIETFDENENETFCAKGIFLFVQIVACNNEVYNVEINKEITWEWIL